MRLNEDLALVDELGLGDVVSRLLAPAVVAAVTGRPLSPRDRERFANIAENNCGQAWREAYLEALLQEAFPRADDDDPSQPHPLIPARPPSNRPGGGR